MRANFEHSLRETISGQQLALLMESHNGLSARIAERIGFKALWASGLAIASSLGLRDHNEASWTQVLDIVEYMTDSVSIPILVDGDSGFGNYNNVRRLVIKLCQRNAAGVVIEDKMFPKMNSFIGNGQALMDVGSFCGKLRAALDHRLSDDFLIVARVEALVAGLEMDEALARAHAYGDTGVDGIFIHSKKADASEIMEFAHRWNRRLPLFIAPTTYSSTPLSALQASGITACICANHSFRAAAQAMTQVARRIFDDRSLSSVESQIASLREIFSLLNYDELEAASSKYEPAAKK